MSGNSSAFTGSILKDYDAGLGPIIFARWLSRWRSMRRPELPRASWKLLVEPALLHGLFVTRCQLRPI
jgi:hypothetical protein